MIVLVKCSVLKRKNAKNLQPSLYDYGFLLTCYMYHFVQKELPCKHFLFSKTFSRLLEDVFSATLFVFQDLLKTYSRRIQDVFAIRLPKTSSRRLPKTSSRRLQDVFARRLTIMSSRRVCKTSCNHVFKTSWKTKKCYTEDVLKTSSVRLHQDECLLGTETYLCEAYAYMQMNKKGFFFLNQT